MNKTQVKKEVAAIRKLYKDYQRVVAELNKRKDEMSHATCPYAVGQVVEWDNELRGTDRGEVYRIAEAYVPEDADKPVATWTLVVHTYRRGTRQLTAYGSARFDSNSRNLRPFLAKEGEAEPRTYRAILDSKNHVLTALRPGEKGPSNCEVLELVEKKPGYRLVKNSK